MSNNDFASSLKECAKTKEEVLQIQEANKIKGREERLRRYSSVFVSAIKATLKELLSYGGFEIQKTPTGKSRVSGEITIYTKFTWVPGYTELKYSYYDDENGIIFAKMTTNMDKYKHIDFASHVGHFSRYDDKCTCFHYFQGCFPFCDIIIPPPIKKFFSTTYPPIEPKETAQNREDLSKFLSFVNASFDGAVIIKNTDNVNLHQYSSGNYMFSRELSFVVEF